MIVSGLGTPPVAADGCRTFRLGRAPAVAPLRNGGRVTPGRGDRAGEQGKGVLRTEREVCGSCAVRHQGAGGDASGPSESEPSLTVLQLRCCRCP
jgi:hypothetical protein